MKRTQLIPATLIVPLALALGLLLVGACGEDSGGSSPSSTKTCKMLQCTVDKDCENPNYFGLFKGGCDTSTNKCKQCGKDAECDKTLFPAGCSTKTYTCAFCKADDNCKVGSMALGTGKCAPSTGLCEKCTTDKDCAPSAGAVGTGKCATSVGLCTKCAADKDCAYKLSAAKLCGSSGSCVECKKDADCSSASVSCTSGGCKCVSGRCELTGIDLACDASCAPPLKCNAAIKKCVCSTADECTKALGKSGLKFECK